MAEAKDRENFVYIAKLAEQAERYDGTPLRTFCPAVLISFIFS